MYYTEEKILELLETGVSEAFEVILKAQLRHLRG